MTRYGRSLELGVVEAPDAEWRKPLEQFLAHKDDFWLAEVSAALAGPLDDLESRFYIATLDGRAVGHVLISGHRGVGVVSHVFTLPEARGQGVAGALLGAAIADRRAAGYDLLTLTTGHGSSAYRIYERHGFASVAPGSGIMRWEARPGALTERFRVEPTFISGLRWQDWGFLNLLASLPAGPDEELPRSPLLGLEGQGCVEGAFIRLQWMRQQSPGIQCRALVTLSGATVGWSILAPSEHEGRWRLDFWVHPLFQDRLSDLVEALDLTDRELEPWSGPCTGRRARALATITR